MGIKPLNTYQNLNDGKSDPAVRLQPAIHQTRGEPTSAGGLGRSSPGNRAASQMPLSALAEVLEARVLEMEQRGFSVRGATALDTQNNLEQLRRAHPELFWAQRPKYGETTVRRAPMITSHGIPSSGQLDCRPRCFRIAE